MSTAGAGTVRPRGSDPTGTPVPCPDAQPPNTFTIKGFKITTQKLPILKAGPIEEMTEKLGIAPPEMIFGDNFVAIDHEPSGWGINFNAFDALDRVDKTGQKMLKVAYSHEWQKSRETTHEGIKEVVKPFDWSYSTDYQGTLRPSAPRFEKSEDPIPIELLKRPDPILFFDDVVLYEDELADNGIAMFSCKIRVMPARLLLLARFFMRLDNVIVRIRDTRVYVDFDAKTVTREHQFRECEYEKIRKSLDAQTPHAVSRAPYSSQSGLLTGRSAGGSDTRFSTLPFIRNPSRDQNKFQHSHLPRRSFHQSSQQHGIAKSLLPRPGTTVETYVAYGLTQKLFEVCSAQADYKIPQISQKGAEVPKTAQGEDLGVGEGWWYTDLGLLPTFSSWSQVTFLHMYLLTVRLRALPSPESLNTYSRHLIDHFSHNAEQRMDVLHGIYSRGIRNKYLKDLFIQWRGILAAYDEGLAKGDAVLGAAVWRNLWKASHTDANGQDIDWAKVARVVAYMRRVLADLAQVDEADLVLVLGRGSAGKPPIFGYSELDKILVEGKRSPAATKAN
ncbi:ubiquinol-cytochrome C chaperone, putative [Paecilomyces variotii No. 5]|uniref:Ubiquinol-cytochrome C chaperone, putative n=1 Tax=Byssochlamys spectabilis (strain No. 5 / NBRC 109023) TaxID=1356009 RepID=V5G8F4_BYSSN|nr:ubiquinol-cytochrome C chaperone, putative [Paecilomyces variotii No. 5]